MSNETKQIAVENISDYLMISAKDAEEFYEWGLTEDWEIYDGTERWVCNKMDFKTNTIVRKMAHIVHVYELYKQYKEAKNLLLLKTV